MDELIATLLRGFTQFQTEIAHLPPAVLAWMWVMRIVFGLCIVFLPRRGALAVLAAMILTALSRFYIKGTNPDLPASAIGALSHVVLWIPLLAILLYGMRTQRFSRASFFDRAYAVWYVIVIAVLTVSLVLDVREVAATFA